MDNMKKRRRYAPARISAAVLLALLFLGSISVSATDQVRLDGRSLADLIAESQDGEVRVFLDAPENYADPQVRERVVGHSVLKLHRSLEWRLADRERTEFVRLSEESEPAAYAVLGETVHLLSVRGESHLLEEETPDARFTAILAELLSLPSETVLCGIPCQITGIDWFGIYDSSFAGTLICFSTDRGDFVRYYPPRETEGRDFTGEEFRRLARGYYAYLSSYNQNYDMWGSPKGGTLPFLSYAEEPNAYRPTPPSYLIWLIPAVLFPTAALGTVLAVCRCKKRMR